MTDNKEWVDPEKLFLRMRFCLKRQFGDKAVARMKDGEMTIGPSATLDAAEYDTLGPAIVLWYDGWMSGVSESRRLHVDTES